LRKLRHDFTELITRALQPALWLLIFGQVFARSGAMHTGNIPYLDFIAPGILAQSVLFVAIFYGINVIWERDLGIVQKFLASPTPRAALVLGKGFSAGIRTLSQGVIVYSLSLLLGVKLNWSPLALLNVLVIVISGRDAVLDVLAGHRVHRQDARALHGRRAGADHAAVLREQRDLSH
jgi:ABC-2 type transport system permease protein